jgi:hypothetical protein
VMLQTIFTDKQLPQQGQAVWQHLTLKDF